MMQIIELNTAPTYMKYSAINKAGYEARRVGRTVRLIDKVNSHADDYVDLDFRNIDEALKVLSSSLLTKGIMITL